MSKWSILTAYSKNGLERKLEEREAQGWAVHPESLNLNIGEDGLLEFWVLLSQD